MTHHRIYDWLRHEFGLGKSFRALESAHLGDADGFVAATRAAFPKTRKWSAAEIARLKQEYTDTLVLLARRRRTCSHLNASFQTSVNLLTASPRMRSA